MMPKMRENAAALAGNLVWFYRNSLEVDFIAREGQRITGIEVKSSSTNAGQLLKLRERYGSKIKDLVLITEKRGEKTDGIKTIPLWGYCPSITQ